MVLLFPMEIRQCVVCKKTSDETHIEPKRNICASCKTTTRQKTMSSTYEAYLRYLHSGAKYTCKAGKRSKDLEFSITPEHLIALWREQGGRCAISGTYLTHHKDGSGTKEYNVSIDRINSDKGYTPLNTQLVCYRINLMKHTLPEDMFYWWVKTIHDFSCD